MCVSVVHNSHNLDCFYFERSVDLAPPALGRTTLTHIRFSEIGPALEERSHFLYNRTRNCMSRYCAKWLFFRYSSQKSFLFLNPILHPRPLTKQLFLEKHLLDLKVVLEIKNQGTYCRLWIFLSSH